MFEYAQYIDNTKHGVTMNKDVTEKKADYSGWLKDIAIALTIALCISFFIKPTIVNGESMEPNFSDGDYLIATRIFSLDSLRKGDVVTFRHTDGRLFIKRVIGVPGDKVKIKDGTVYINGIEDDQSYTNEGITNGEINLTVPDDTVFCMGDNRLNSHDSRDEDVGCISIDKLKWKVQARILPINRATTGFNVYG